MWRSGLPLHIAGRVWLQVFLRWIATLASIVGATIFVWVFWRWACAVHATLGWLVIAIVLLTLGAIGRYHLPRF